MDDSVDLFQTDQTVVVAIFLNGTSFLEVGIIKMIQVLHHRILGIYVQLLIIPIVPEQILQLGSKGNVHTVDQVVQQCQRMPGSGLGDLCDAAVEAGLVGFNKLPVEAEIIPLVELT